MALGTKKAFDFGIGWSEKEDDLFINTLKSECKMRRLSFSLINKKLIDKLTPRVKKGEFKIRFFLDMASETHNPKDSFTRFVYCLKDNGARIVADPDNVNYSADKSITHFNLVKAKIPVPFTIVIRNWEPKRRLTDEEKEELGLPFVVKPALGYAQQGIKIIKDKVSLEEIAQARKFSPGDNFLLQEFVQPQDLEGEPAWFRIFYLFGEIFPCWWNPQTHVYRQVTVKDFDSFKLTPLVRLVSEIARITRIELFSCEIAINNADKKFVVIDYMNDQCAVCPQSRDIDGVPDDLLVLIAQRMVEKAWQHVMGNFTLTHRAVWFSKIKLKDEDV